MTRDRYRRWVVEALRALGGTASPHQVYAWVKANKAVPMIELSRRVSNGELFYQKEIRFARWELRRAGEVLAPTRGMWMLA